MKRAFAFCLGVLGLMGAGLAQVSVAEGKTGASYQTPNAVVERMSSPRSLYMLRCSGCHRVDGTGAIEAGIPPFPGFIGPLARNPQGRVYIAHVPGVVGSRMSNDQLVGVLNYVLEEWSGEEGASAPAFTVEEFVTLRSVPVSNVVQYRRDVVAEMKAAGDPVADYPWP